MTNFEKLLQNREMLKNFIADALDNDYGVSDDYKINGCRWVECDKCLLRTTDGNCKAGKWLDENYECLTEREYHFIRSLDPEWWISRYAYGGLTVHHEKPYRVSNDSWGSKGNSFCVNGLMFKPQETLTMVTLEKPWQVKGLLQLGRENSNEQES